VLVVDDSEDTAESLATLLSVAGHKVRTALDGEAALKAAQEFRPEAVLLDIGLPGMDGYTVARQLRQLPGLEKALLVAITGYGREEDRQHSREAGFDHHLVKPVDLKQLRELLAALPAEKSGGS
jgi:two-component system CheB/CheR fusion protein